MNPHASQVIKALGGPAKTARIFKISAPSASNWRKDGIPEARMMFLRLAKRKQLAGIDLDAATSPRSPSGKRASAIPEAV